MDVRYAFHRFRVELSLTLKRPGRLVRLVDGKQLRMFLRSLRPPSTPPPAEWQLIPREGFRVRAYADYDTYLRHQQLKLAKMEGPEVLDRYQDRFRRVLRARLEASGLLSPGMTVLCLGARRGAEVQAFLEMGCFAVGIDVNPGTENKYVLYGDFHDLQFAAGSVDVAFTNSLDHALDIERIAGEVRRVLKVGGLLMIEASRGAAEGHTPGFYESFYWASIDDLAEVFTRGGFSLISRTPIEEPRPGEQLRFRMERREETGGHA